MFRSFWIHRDRKNHRNSGKSLETHGESTVNQRGFHREIPMDPMGHDQQKPFSLEAMVHVYILLLIELSMAISGTDWLEVPAIYRPIFQAYVREYPQKIWSYMVQYLHFRILKFPLKLLNLVNFNSYVRQRRERERFPLMITYLHLGCEGFHPALNQPAGGIVS